MKLLLNLFELSLTWWILLRLVGILVAFMLKVTCRKFRARFFLVLVVECRYHMTSGSVVQNVRSKNVALTPIESCISILDLNLYIYLYIYIFFNLRSKQIKRSPWKISIWGRFLGHLQFFGQSSCLRNFFCELTFWTVLTWEQAWPVVTFLNRRLAVQRGRWICSLSAY